MEGSERAYQLLRLLGTDKAARYQKYVLLPQIGRLLRLNAHDESAVRDSLSDSYNVLRILYGYYAFARRGGKRSEYSAYALEALSSVVPKPYDIDSFLRDGKPEDIWNAFENICKENHRKTSEQLNRGMLEGFIKLAMDIYREDGLGNIFSWIQESVVMSQKVEPRFLRLVEISGVGPKLASLILRDVVWLFKLEDRILYMDRLYLQPIDAWVRSIAELLIDEVQGDTTADWVIAGKLCKAARLANVSSVNLSHGIQFFGNYELHDMHDLPQYLEFIIANAPAKPKPYNNDPQKKPRRYS